MAVATDRIHELRQLSVPAEGATVELEASADWGPGAYMLATIQRPVGRARDHEPVRAVGIAWAGIDQSARKLAVEIKTPDVARPRSRLSLPVAVTGAADEPVWLTLAAVDEGILQLTRFRTPDPESHYFAKRRLGLELRDDYGHLLDGNSGTVGAIRAGGDAALGGGGLPVVPTRTVALFSGVVDVDRNGQASIDLDLPDFAGQLRLMAVAFGKSRIGHGEARLLVRDPVVAEVSLPRFLAPGDTGRLTLLVHNVEGPAGAYKVAFGLEGPIGFDAPVEPMYELPADGRRTESFPLHGTGEGIGTIRLTLSGPGGFAIRREWQIAVRSPWFPITLESASNQSPGDVLTVDPRLLEAWCAASMSGVCCNRSGAIPTAALNRRSAPPCRCSTSTTPACSPKAANPASLRAASLKMRPLYASACSMPSIPSSTARTSKAASASGGWATTSSPIGWKPMR
jgi:uncharacterized protein YfaS (alpha-2-macroglobulin family)